jgi:hypothetical protein
MLKRNFFCFLILGALFYLRTNSALACDACGCTLSKIGEHTQGSEEKKPWFFDFMVEQQNWKKKDAQAANDLISEGHDFHDKTHEEFYHFMLGVHPMGHFTILAEMPYVVREAIEVEDTDHLGEKQHSEGWGDLSLFGIYKILVEGDDFLGITGGVKFPTGETREKNFQGERFEVELQPGSGSYDYPLGIVYRHEIKPIVLSGNVSYVIKTKGSKEFEYGDLFFASLNADYVLNPKARVFQTKVGLAMNIHHEQKQTDHGEKKEDSGETSLFLGPSLNIKANDMISIFGSILFPAYQTTGGVHQKLDNLWTAGVKVIW